MNDRIYAKIRKNLQEARHYSILTYKLEKEIFDLLDELGIDDTDTIDTNAENSSNLEDVISCYIQYGEYSIDGLMKEIKEAADR